MTRTYALIAGPLLAALISCNDGVSTRLDFIVTPEEVSLPAPNARLGYATKSIFITNISGRALTLSELGIDEADETSELTLRIEDRERSDEALKLSKGQSVEVEVRWREPRAVERRAEEEDLLDRIAWREERAPTAKELLLD